MDSLWVDYVAGIFGGVAVVLVGHPFDTTKTRLQTSPPNFYASASDCVQKTLRWEGVEGFYKGIWSPLAGQMIFRAVSFGTFTASVHFVSKNSTNDVPNASNIVAAGAITGFVVSVVETPIDLCKTRLQTQIFRSQIYPESKPLFTTVRGFLEHRIYRHGLGSLWQGWTATVIRNVPANAMLYPGRLPEYI
mmetsp:Transcript_38142/g.38833  ORF Transcript_38142/g.38833 Transcript_38142/m.38833 type:complete len:191 (+) Transcript_38142:94-666(+)